MMQKYATRDVALLSGWLFADLLLGLAVIFLVSIPGLPAQLPKIIPPPRMQVTPNKLTTGNCKGSGDSYQCTLTLSETGDSQGHIQWNASGDMSNKTTFAPAGGTLAPQQATQITIANIPCQNGSFTFSGSVPDSEHIPNSIFGTHNVQPLTVLWSCTLESVKLNLIPIIYKWQVSDVGNLNKGDPGVADEIRQQAQRDIASHPHVGFVIIYGGANANDTSLGDRVSVTVSGILKQYGQSGFTPLQDAVFYNPDPGLHSANQGYGPGDIEVNIFDYSR